jgi:alpha-beta hydrolase superfamily lysophospholipase
VTLVRACAGRLGGEDGSRPSAVVLHVHGYNDYFFQAHLASALTRAGYAFVAVDVRRAGRSWRPGEVPHYVDDLHEHAADLALAAAAVRAMHPGLPLVVHAHSTGGLTAALWAHSARRGADGPDALVLDSPFLDLRSSWFNRTVGTRLLDAVGPYAPLRPMTSAPSVYATHQHVRNGGRWEFDTTLKRPEGLPVRAGWLRAVRRGQARLERGLDIAPPVLVGRSARSGPDREGNPGLDREDTVLDVQSIARLAHRLGRDVTELVVEGGVHDLTLSADGPRAAYLDGVLAWLDDRLGPRTAGGGR